MASRTLATNGARIGLDPALAADRLRAIVEEAGGAVVEMADPAQLPRAAKNAVEIEGARRAHRATAWPSRASCAGWTGRSRAPSTRSARPPG
jgi:Xaa-Pro aminopeptidase